MINESKNSTHKSPEILIAEDSTTQAEQIKHLLESHNYKVTIAGDGKKAMDWLVNHKPSIVISDIMMPEINGYELCKKIKSNKTTGHIPVILLTQLFDADEIIEGLSCGADSFITKPYHEEFLLSHIKKLLTEENPTEHKKVPFGVEILYKGEKRQIQAEQQNVIKLMLSIYEGAIQQNEKLIQTQEELRTLNEHLESIVEERTSDLLDEIKLSNEIANRLKESEERYHNLYNDAVVGLYRTNSHGEILLANRALVKMLGFQSQEELAKINLNETAKGSNYNRREFIDKIEKNSEVRDLEAIWIRSDGKEIFVRENAKVIRDCEGKILYYEGTVEDISDWKKAENALLQSHMFNESLLKTIPFAMDIVDESGTILYQSDILTILFEKEGIGKKCWDLYKDDKKQCSNCPLIKGISIGETDTYESLGVLGNRIFEISHTGMLYEGKKAMLEIFQDITEQKAREKDLIKAKEKAEESDRLKSAFLTNMSHEIRTPMNGILGFTELLKEPLLTVEEQLDFIQTIQISGARMLNTIKSIVDISKIESGMMRVDITETNLNEKLEFTYKFFKPEVENKGVQFLFKTRLSANEAIIYTDNEKVHGILTNLIKNAIKFTDNGSIEFGCSIVKTQNTESLEFFVKDTGEGIPRDQQEMIFERFRQGSESFNRKYEGSGLGLSISKSYVEMLGGRIWVESQEGSGSAFYFTIPYKPVSEDILPIENAVFTENIEVQIEKLKILIVEDDEISHSLLTRTIQKISKGVIHAITGVEAVEACRNNPDFDLVLMDIRMPQMNGLEATKQIRQFNKDVIIIAQTAYGFSGDREMAIEAGCNDYISKPINKGELLRLVEKYFQKKKTTIDKSINL